MFPSCLPLSFNAKVLAKDIFLLLRVFQHSVLHCGLGSPALTLGSVPRPGPFTRLKASGARGGLGCSVSLWDLLKKVAYVF